MNHHDYKVNEMTKSVSNLNGTNFEIQNDAVDRMSIDRLNDNDNAISIHFINELIHYLLLLVPCWTKQSSLNTARLRSLWHAMNI